MKNKKGFSLVELLIVIAIVGVLVGIIVPSVVRYLKGGKEEYNTKLDTELVTVAKSYYAENKGKLPRGNLDSNGLRITKALISASYLVNNNYMTGEFKDSEGNDCTSTSYVIVEREVNDYKYTSCIICNNEGYKNNSFANAKCNYKAPSADGTIKDNILPRCELTYKSGTINNWTNQNVYLTLTAEDNDELAYYYLNKDAVGTGKSFENNPNYSTVEIEIKDNINTNSYYVTVEDASTGKIQCTFDGSIKIDKVVPTVSLTATKKSANVAVPTNTWSNEGLNFKLTKGTTGLSGYTIYYCKDTTNSCTPNEVITNNTSITKYNTITGTYYIRYKIVSGSGVSSSVGSYTAKVDTTVPTVSIVATKKTAGTTVSSASSSNEGLNFKLTKGTTGPSGYTIYYCKDTTNSCTPSTKATSGTLITSYNEITDKYYIRYKIVSGAGLSSSVGSYQANVIKDALPSKVVLYNYAYNNSYVYNSEVGQKIVVYIPELTDISHLTITRTFYGKTITISPNSFTYQSSCDSVSGITSNCFKYTDKISGYAVKGYYAEYKVCNSSNTCKSNSTLISLRGCLHITNKTGKNCWNNIDSMCDATKSGCTGNKFYSSSYDRFFIGQFTKNSAVFNRTPGFGCYMWNGSIEQVADYRCDLHPEGTGQSTYGEGDY